MSSSLRFRWVPLLVCGMIYLAACEKNQPPKSDQEVTGEFPTSTATNTVTLFTTAGMKTTEIFSDSVITFAEQDSTQAYRLRVNFFDRQGEQMSVLTADSGVIREKTERLEVFGRVNVTTRDSMFLQTTQLAWDPGTKKIISDSLVTVNYQGSIIRGWGMESSPDLTNMTFRKSSGEIPDYDQVLDSL